MIQSMTGFASKEAIIRPFGKISVELKSSNHKFLEIVFHLPEGFLSLEDRIKKEIEAKIKRGRITCVINIISKKTAAVFINKPLLRNYITNLKKINQEFRLKDEISINTLMHLPGILSLEEDKITATLSWSSLRALVSRTADELLKTRQKEGRALYGYLKNRQETLKASLALIKTRFKKALKNKLDSIAAEEERTAFLKSSDITEEVERLMYHLENFRHKLSKVGPIGKELDFIAQEMQREANTLAAKSFDALVVGQVVQMKSQIEKIREQVQNIE